MRVGAFGVPVFVLALYVFLSGVCRVKWVFLPSVALDLPMKAFVVPDCDSGCRGSNPVSHPTLPNCAEAEFSGARWTAHQTFRREIGNKPKCNGCFSAESASTSRRMVIIR